MNPAAPATTKAETTTTTSSSSSSRSSSSEKNIDNAIAFLVHPSVKNATTKSSKEKRAFLRGKGVTDEEISTAFARAGVREDDDDKEEEEEEEDFNTTNNVGVGKYHPTPLSALNNNNNNNNNRPPAVPYGVIHRRHGEGMRWTQMVAYAAALCAFGSYAYPRVKRYLSLIHI